MIKQQSSTPTTPPLVPDLSAIISNASLASLAAETLPSNSSSNRRETTEFPATPLSLSLKEALALRVLEKLARVDELLVNSKRGKREEELLLLATVSASLGRGGWERRESHGEPKLSVIFVGIFGWAKDEEAWREFVCVFLVFFWRIKMRNERLSEDDWRGRDGVWEIACMLVYGMEI
jgi:hypothetical protein